MAPTPFLTLPSDIGSRLLGSGLDRRAADHIIGLEQPELSNSSPLVILSMALAIPTEEILISVDRHASESVNNQPL
jgi:hypothetical protein